MTATATATAAGVVAHTDVPRALAARIKLAELLAGSTLLPDDYRGNSANILACQFAADSLDIPLWTAMQELYVAPRGKIGMSALLMRGLIIRAGHKFTVLESGESTATVQIHRAGEAHPRPAVSFTMREAFTAGLVKQDSNYAKFGPDMLVARATARCARRYAADVVLGFGYVPGDFLDEQLEAVEVFVDAPPPSEPAAEPEQPVEAPAGKTPPAELPMPATVGDLVDEVAAIVPGPNAKTRKAATERLRALWSYVRAERWSNLPCQPDGMFVGALILERQEWIKKAKFGTPADHESAPKTQPCPAKYRTITPPEAHPFTAPAGDPVAA